MYDSIDLALGYGTLYDIINLALLKSYSAMYDIIDLANRYCTNYRIIDLSIRYSTM